MKARALILVFVALAAVFLAGAYAWRANREHEQEQTVAIGGPSSSPTRTAARSTRAC